MEHLFHLTVVCLVAGMCVGKVVPSHNQRFDEQQQQQHQLQRKGSANTSCQFRTGVFDFDLSPLTLPAGQHYSANSTRFEYNLNICGTADTSDCDSDGAICQYQNSNQFVATVARWGSGAAWSFIDTQDPSAGIKLSFNNGDVCPADNNPRLAAIEFVCGTSKLDSITVNQQSTPCMYSFTVRTSLVCLKPPPPPAVDCTFTSGTYFFNFSALSLEDKFYTVKAVSSGVPYTYDINVCRNSVDPNCAPSGKTYICQYNNEGWASSLGAWTPGSTGGPKWAWIDPKDPQKGVSVTTVDGPALGCPSARTVHTQFVCGTSPTPNITVVESPACVYTVQFTTPLACIRPQEEL